MRRPTNRVSVVVPVRNGAGTIVRAITSIQKSLRQQDELIVVDDSSDDNTVAAIEALNANVRVEPSPGSGIVDALNHGIKLADSDLIARCDADDQWLARDLDHEIRLLTRHGAVAVFGGAERVYPDGTLRYDLPPTRGRDIRQAMLRTNILVHGSAIFRRDVVESVGGYRHIAGVEDYDLWMRLLRRGDIATSRDVVYRYYESPPTVHRRKRRVQALGSFRIQVENGLRTGHASPIGIGRNLASALYPGRRR